MAIGAAAAAMVEMHWIGVCSAAIHSQTDQGNNKITDIPQPDFGKVYSVKGEHMKNFD